MSVGYLLQTGNRLLLPVTKVAIPAGMKIMRVPSIDSSIAPQFLSTCAWARAIGKFALVDQPSRIAPALVDVFDCVH